MRRIGVAAIGLAVALAGPARGLTLLADDRFVLSSFEGSRVPESFLAPFNVTVLGAGQRSSIAVSPDGLGFDASARGFADGFITERDPGEFILVTGESVFSIRFSLDRPGQLDLTGEIFNYGGDPQYASVRLLSGSDLLFDVSGGRFLDLSTAIPAGIYRFEARATAPSYDLIAGFLDLDLQVREVPEPTGAMLIGLGLAALAGSRSRRRALRERRAGEGLLLRWGSAATS